MGAKNQVTLTFAGDSSKLTQTFDEVGSAAKSMGDDVGRASRDVGRDLDGGFDKASDAADDAEGKFQGMASTLEGTTDTAAGFAAIAKGDLYGGLIQVGQGGADLAEGLNYTVIPVLKKTVLAIKNTTVAQKALNLAMRMNPIGIVITGLILLAGLFVLLWKRSETFRNIVQGAMRGVAAAFGWIVKGFGAAWTAVSGAWSRFVGWIRGWPRSIAIRVWSMFSAVASAWFNIHLAVISAVGRFFSWVGGWGGAIRARVGGMFGAVVSAWNNVHTWVIGAAGRFFTWVGGFPSAIGSRTRGMFNGIKDAFKSALNWVIGKWNNLSFRIPGVDSHIPGIGVIGGFTLNTPDIPHFHRGGIMPGAPGTEGLAMLQAGERVTPAGRSEPVEIVVRSGGSRFDDLLVEVLRHAIQVKGGNVQKVLGAT